MLEFRFSEEATKNDKIFLLVLNLLSKKDCAKILMHFSE